MCKTCLICTSFVCFTHGIKGFLFQSAFYFLILLKDEVPFLLPSFTKRIKTRSVSLFSLCEQHPHPMKHLIAFYKYDFQWGQTSSSHCSLFLLQDCRWCSSGRFLNSFPKCRCHHLALNLLQINMPVMCETNLGGIL